MAERERPDRVPELDGLRGVAILLVLLFHYISIEGLTKTGSWSFILQRIVIMGWTGVDLFFVLSGFLIGGILIDARGSPTYFKTFYVRRFFRIIPVYYLWILGYVLLVSMGGAFVRAHSHSGAVLQVGQAIYAHFLFLQNLGFIHVSGLTGAWFSHTWSLAVEEQFYLVAPLVIWFLSPRRLFIFLAVIVAGVPLLRFCLLQYFHAAPWLVGVVMPTRADSFAVGMLAAILWRNASVRARLATRPAYPKIISRSTERDFGHRESFYYIAATHGEAGVPARPERTPVGLAIRESSGTVLWRCEFHKIRKTTGEDARRSISHQPSAISHKPPARYFTSCMLTIFEAA